MAGDISMKSGMIWTSVQKFGNMGISFISNIILARLLVPAEYGTIGVLMVFIAFSEVFIDGGFASALIQKKDVTDKDYNSVFIVNILISIVFYIGLLVSAPYISVFFHDSALIGTLRVMGLVLIFNSLSIIQQTQIQKSLEFKKLSLYNLIAIVFGTILAIILALLNFGVWSLVYKTLSTSVVLCIILWVKSRWRPKFQFSYSRIRCLFNFGSFIFLSTLIEYIYAYIQPVLIGRFFSMRQLGYFTQARKIEEIPANSFVGVITSVMFPVLSKLSSDISLLIEKACRALKLVSFISFPLMAWMAICSDKIIYILLGEKWVEAAPFLSILCIAGVFRVPSGNNMCIIKSLGKSKTFMYVQIIKRIGGLVCILIGLHFGLIGLIWGFSISNVIFFIIDSIVTGRYSSFGLIKQIKIISPYIIISIIASGILYVVRWSYGGSFNGILGFITDTIIFIILYLGIAALFKLDAYKYYYHLILSKNRNVKDVK